jgi:pilus assembly protein Flp/PilA
MKTFLKNFVADESGASAAEYALILAIVGVGIGAAALSLGANVQAAIGGASTDVYECNNGTGVTGAYTPGGTC